MRPASTLSRLLRTAALALLATLTAHGASAQQSRTMSPDLEAAVTPGETVWITRASRPEQKVRVVGISGDILTAAADSGLLRVGTSEVAKVRARRSDSLLNGALIGAGVAVASGLYICRSMEPWSVCRNNVGPLVRLGAVGAGIGIGVDALIRGRRTIYEAPQRSVILHAAPLIAHRARGVQVSFSF